MANYVAFSMHLKLLNKRLFMVLNYSLISVKYALSEQIISDYIARYSIQKANKLKI